jgi:Tfp pilus assembly protein PilF
LIWREQGQRALAFADFEAANKKRPDLVEAGIQLGVMKLEAGNTTDAQPLLEFAVKMAPKNALAHLNLGDCYRLAGRPTEAKSEFDRALSLDSSLAVVHYDMGLLYLFSPSIPGSDSKGQVAVAIRELETYKSMRGASKLPSGQQDDTDELLTRAKAKQAEMNQPQAAAPPPAAASAKPPTAATAAPRASGSAAPAGKGGIVRDMQ